MIRFIVQTCNAQEKLIQKSFEIQKGKVFLDQVGMDTIFNLHDWIGANRAHGTEVKNCEENQHRLLQIRTDVSGGVASKHQKLGPHMQAGALMAVDKEVDNVEDIQGRPGEKEDHADTHQNP